jgi:hypothetical protein
MLLDPIIEIEQREQGGEHERAKGETLAEGLLHYSTTVLLARRAGGIIWIFGGLAIVLICLAGFRGEIAAGLIESAKSPIAGGEFGQGFVKVFDGEIGP